MKTQYVAAVMACALLLTRSAGADVVIMEPVRDNSLFENCAVDCQDTGSNGAGSFLFSGSTSFFGRRRALLAFDVAGHIPAGATIVSASLKLHASTPFDGVATGSQNFTLHRLTADWGEGNSNSGDPGGGGELPDVGDATWLHRFFDTDFWSSPGGDGDFIAAPSAERIVDTNGFYTFGATPELTADVQTMLDDPANDFGWILTGVEEMPTTAKRFDSRENMVPENRPTLVVEFVSSPTAAVPASSSGSVLVAALMVCLMGTAAVARGRSVSS